jgi:hypothetical protein
MKERMDRPPIDDPRDDLLVSVEGEEGAGYGGMEEIRLRGRPVRRGDDRETGSPRGLGPGGWKGLKFLASGLAFVLIVALILAAVRRPRSGEVRSGTDAAPYGPATRSFTLYFLDPKGELVPEAREVPAKATQAAQIQAVIAEELAGSMGGYASPFPAGTQLLHVFVSTDGLVAIDLSRDVTRNHPGGMESEYATLAALVRSVKENFPEATAIQILIEGEPVPTLAGHFAIESPLIGEEWQ